MQSPVSLAETFKPIAETRMGEPNAIDAEEVEG